MGNIAFNSFKRDMSDDDFTRALEEIVRDRFDERVEVRPTMHNGKLCSWVIGPRKELVGDKHWAYEWEVYRYSKRKFGGKHPHSDWGRWLMGVLQNELAFRHNGRISDEGVSGTWAGDPTKYPNTYEEWIEKYWLDFYEETGDPFVKVLKEKQLARMPVGLSKR